MINDIMKLQVFDLTPVLLELQALPDGDSSKDRLRDDAGAHSQASLPANGYHTTSSKLEGLPACQSLLQPSSELQRMSAEVARCLRETGALILRDPRVTDEDNSHFLDMMERYFGQADEIKKREARPDLLFQVGVTPDGFEIPRAAIDPTMQESIRLQPLEHRAHVPTGADRKWRYMWRIGARAPSTKFKELNAEPVVPRCFPEWAASFDSWGQKLVAAVESVATLTAIGFDLPPNAFTSLMDKGPHLLAPTGSNLAEHGEKGTIFAGYHYDFNFLTIHGRCRFPGLFIWTRDGHRVEVSVPKGCLLLQAGKQLEWLTGGEVRAGMHEVVVSDRTIAAVEEAQQQQRSLWRVSSTLFAHVGSDNTLRPLNAFASAPEAASYPPMLAGDFCEAELAAINLKTKRVQATNGML
eukprot:TRINITY_DN1441_c0_g1_i1.p1 TRINITY_DN1441_c0_g1~~TRINITY_DN1441_c0_g1_i1.p1  ORF type:complete len:411 (+),score=78.15 TRINITY_DN1441_c0_g1_i1:210-1442(+)